jgi:hypothetical protein
MTPILTTVTPVWGRSEAFHYWMDSLDRAAAPGVQHLVYCVGESSPKPRRNFEFVRANSPELSIGHFHNLAAERIESPWMMKLDLDAIPNELFFENLLAVLHRADPLDWYNAGMVYLNEAMSSAYLSRPLTLQGYTYLMNNRRRVSLHAYAEPGGSNFICRREHYRTAGGADERFRGWGWEDYQQTFALESLRRGRSPLPSVPNLTTVTSLCRDTITRPKAAELLALSPFLCLLHRFHPPANRKHSMPNRKVLLDYILQYYERRRHGIPSQDAAGKTD